MAITLVEVKKNTRGVNSREIKYNAIGKWVEKTVQRDTRPSFLPDGTKELDAQGNEVRLPLEKDKEGKNIYVDETVLTFESDGVLTDIGDALELVNNDEQLLLDCFADGFNERQYAKESSKDELDDFLSKMSMTDDQKFVFKKTARQLNRGTGMPILEAADFIKGMMDKQKPKANASA